MFLDAFQRVQRSFLKPIAQSFVVHRHFVYFACLVFGFSILDGCTAAICGGRITEPSGSVKSPGYPRKALTSFTCKWVIVAQSYQTILLSFPVFNVMMGTSINQSMTLCDRDYVEVIDGKKSLGKYCNSYRKYPKGTITSKSNNVTIVFKSVGYHYGGGSLFQATYKTQCVSFLTGMSGEVTSPNYPNPYPAPMYCTWRIIVPEGFVIKFFFLEFNLESTSKCNTDYLKATDGLNTTSRLIGHFCASRTPPKWLRSTDHTLTLEFKSFTPTLNGGFNFYYQTELHCGGVLKGNTGSFTSPGFRTPTHIQSPQNCIWVIEVPPKMVVSVVFASFDINSSPRCTSDYVEVRDGSGNSSFSKGRYCGRNVVNPPMVHSTKNSMVIILHRSTKSGSGFFATYVAVDPKNPYDKCARASDEILYKCNNGNYIQCQWKCDGTDDCGDSSDEANCAISTNNPKQSSKITSYVIILVSITGSAILIALLIFVVDRLRRKRRSQASNRRRRRRRARLRALDTDSREACSPPPTYDFAVAGSSCCDTTSMPPSYADSITPANNIEETEITESTDAEQSASSQPVTDNQQVPESRRDEVEVECISLGGSPPSSDTSPLIV